MGQDTSNDNQTLAASLLRYQQRIDQLEAENRRLRRKPPRRERDDSAARDLAILREVSSAIVSELDLRRVFELVAEKAREIIAADTVLVPMISADRLEYRYVAASGKNAEEILYTHFPIHVGMCGWVLTHEAPLLYGEGALFALDKSTRWEQGQTSALLVPLLGKNRIIGGLSALGKQGGGSFTSSDMDMIILFANQVSIAIENASLVQELRKTLDTLEQRIETRTAELTEINRELESFCYSASHDLRTPLRGIDGYSQTLMDDYPELLDETARDYLQRIRAGSQRMQQIIDDLLRLSEVVRKTVHRERVNLSDIASKLVAHYQSRTPEHRITVVVAPDLYAEGDPELLEMALDGLIGNAWKFTRRTAEPRIEFGRRTEDGSVVLFVRDNGCGFDMAYKNTLFEPFQHAHTDDDYAGSGVGLAIVERIIKRHAGHIWAVSEPGKGTTFLFTLPPPGD